MNHFALIKDLFLISMVFIPGIIIMGLLWAEIKKNKQKRRFEKALHLPPEIVIEQQKSLITIESIPKSLQLIILCVVTIILLSTNLSYYFIAVIVFCVFYCLRSISEMFRNHHLTQLSEALPSTIDFFARSIKTGDSFNSAIEAAAQANLVVSKKFKPIYESLCVGKPFAETLKQAAIKENQPDFSLFIAVLISQQETGTHDTTSLSYLAKILRGKIALRRKIRANSSEARLSCHIIGVMPIIAAICLELFQPGYMSQMFHTKSGQYLLVYALCSNLIGLVIMKKMTQIVI